VLEHFEQCPMIACSYYHNNDT